MMPSLLCSSLLHAKQSPFLSCCPELAARMYSITHNAQPLVQQPACALHWAVQQPAHQEAPATCSSSNSSSTKNTKVQNSATACLANLNRGGKGQVIQYCKHTLKVQGCRTLVCGIVLQQHSVQCRAPPAAAPVVSLSSLVW
jgi:hypothetical protein